MPNKFDFLDKVIPTAGDIYRGCGLVLGLGFLMGVMAATLAYLAFS